ARVRRELRLLVCSCACGPSVYGRCFFFFQAEDGIRDRNVTGVQTCALPIWGLQSARFVFVDESTDEVLIRSFLRHDGLLKQPRRSEERRVGKECRAGWWAER